MFAAVRRLITTHRSAEHASHDSDIPAASLRPRGALMAMLGLFLGAGVWVLLTTLGEAFAAQVCYRHGMAPDWLMPTLGAATAGALLIGLVGAVAAWRHWRQLHGKSSDSVRTMPDRSMGRRRYVAMAGVLLSLLFLVGLAAVGLAVLLVSPCSPWH